jgi:hypothetical protein
MFRKRVRDSGWMFNNREFGALIFGILDTAFHIPNRVKVFIEFKPVRGA